MQKSLWLYFVLVLASAQSIHAQAASSDSPPSTSPSSTSAASRNTSGAANTNADEAQNVPDAITNTPFVLQANAGFMSFFSPGYGTLFNLGGAIEFKLHEAERFSVAAGAAIDANWATARLIAPMDLYRFMVRLRVRIPVWSNRAVSLSVLPVLQMGFGLSVWSGVPGNNGADAAFVADTGVEVRARLERAFFAWLRPIGFAFNYITRASSLEAAYLAQAGAGWYF